MKIILPYPPKVLQGNGGKKTHWGKRYRIEQKYKTDCKYIASQIRPKKTDKDLHLAITFHPKTRNAVDRDNLITGFKYGQDALAAAWKIDDSRFIPHYAIGHPVKGGSVEIEVLQ
jgi:Holliday junction resolvase RusA-like endonuclease